MPTAAKTRTRKPPPPPPAPERTIPGGNDGFFPDEKEDIPEVEKRHRTPKLEKLEGAVAGMYIMTGGALSTLPAQFVPVQVKVVGINLARSCDEIAEAWIDLAEDDRRVLKALESLTSFSGWGKIAGVHLMAIGTAVPAVAAAMPSPVATAQAGARQEAASTSDIQNAMILAEMFKQSQSQQRAEPSPVERVFEEAQQQPAPQRQQQPVRRTGPVSTRPGRNAGIPSAADLGVSIADTPADFPTAGPENIRG
jgi:hypothetical protein